MDEFDVIVSHPGGRGWGPVERLADLAARTLQGRLIRLDASAAYSVPYLLRSAAPRRRTGSRHCLVIAPQARHLAAVLSGRVMLTRYRSISGWIIDSFEHEKVPRVARSPNHFDRLWVTDPDDIPPWQARVRCPVACVMWGTDAMAGSSATCERTTDLLRVGRQPDCWDDDESVHRQANARGVSFAGRPPFGRDDIETDRLLRRALSGAKFVLAFSNRVSPTYYTHPTREYITGRWTDALGFGAVVAGVRPRSAAADALLWPGSTLEISPTSVEEGLDELQQGLRHWTPDVVVGNQVMALRTLDWRHRIAQVLAGVDAESDSLAEALEQLEVTAQRLSSDRPEPTSPNSL